jgi:hypothetical protein
LAALESAQSEQQRQRQDAAFGLGALKRRPYNYKERSSSLARQNATAKKPVRLGAGTAVPCPYHPQKPRVGSRFRTALADSRAAGPEEAFGTQTARLKTAAT